MSQAVILMYGISIPNPSKLSVQQVEDIESLSDVYNLECDINRDTNDEIETMTIGIHSNNLIASGTPAFGATFEELNDMKKEFEECYTPEFISQLSETLGDYQEGLDLAMHLTLGAKVIAIAYNT